MRIERSIRYIVRENRTVISICYFSDSGVEIAHFMDNSKNEKDSKILLFSTNTMEVQCYEPKSKTMSFIQRAKPEYRADIQQIIEQYPGVPQSEFIS